MTDEMEAPQKTNDAVRSALLKGLTVSDFDPDKVLSRLEAAYERAVHQYYYAQLIGTGFSIFYFIKSIGLRLDLVFFDVKIFEVPYGNFVFCIIAQFFFIGSCVRFMDVRSTDRYIRAVCDLHYSKASNLVHMSIKGTREWTDAFFFAFNLLRTHSFFKILAGIIGLFSGIIMLSIFCMPVISGLHFLGNVSSMADKSNVDFERGAVLVSTISSLLFFLLTFLFFHVDNDEAI